MTRAEPIDVAGPGYGWSPADVTGERNGCIAWQSTAVISPAGEVAVQLPSNRPGLLVFDLSC